MTVPPAFQLQVYRAVIGSWLADSLGATKTLIVYTCVTHYTEMIHFNLTAERRKRCTDSDQTRRESMWLTLCFSVFPVLEQTSEVCREFTSSMSPRKGKHQWMDERLRDWRLSPLSCFYLLRFTSHWSQHQPHLLCLKPILLNLQPFLCSPSITKAHTHDFSL